MKFIVSKKIIDNRSLYVSVLWMLLFLVVALGLSLVAKGIDFGVTPAMWVNTVLGNEEEFIEPLLVSDLLLSLHTDLFGLILVFILISALVVRTSRSKVLKIALLSAGIGSLLLYAIGLIASLWIGSVAVMLSWCGFILFHLLMSVSSLDLLILLLRKKF